MDLAWKRKNISLVKIIREIGRNPVQNLKARRKRKGHKPNRSDKFNKP